MNCRHPFLAVLLVLCLLTSIASLASSIFFTVRLTEEFEEAITAVRNAAVESIPKPKQKLTADEPWVQPEERLNTDTVVPSNKVKPKPAPKKVTPIKADAEVTVYASKEPPCMKHLIECTTRGKDKPGVLLACRPMTLLTTRPCTQLASNGGV